MSKFRVLRQSQLSERDFDEYPVWSEHYDWDEIEEIERWGLDREYVFPIGYETEFKSKDGALIAGKFTYGVWDT